ncbi:unnamed protein product, partial [Heterotrigona itama]
VTRNEEAADGEVASRYIYVHMCRRGIVHRNSLIKTIFTRSYHIFATGRSRSRIYYTTVIRTADTMLRAGHADDADDAPSADDN